MLPEARKPVTNQNFISNDSRLDPDFGRKRCGGLKKTFEEEEECMEERQRGKPGLVTLLDALQWGRRGGIKGMGTEGKEIGGAIRVKGR